MMRYSTPASRVPRDFALSFLGDNPLKPGDSRKVKLKINGKRYDVLIQRSGPAREYRIVYAAESDAAHTLREYLGDNLKSGEDGLHAQGIGQI